jgi:hypothetical protein
MSKRVIKFKIEELQGFCLYHKKVIFIFSGFELVELFIVLSLCERIAR